jgi:DMSO/TMAO reductase YedYZ molybdopterin-dependent catalytic subunit
MNRSESLRHVLTIGIAFAVLAAILLDAQGTGNSEELIIRGDVQKPITVSAVDMKSMTRKTVTVNQEGRMATYEGVLLADILTRAGAPLGRGFTGPAVATYVVATAADGYQVAFSLGEIDPALTSSDIIVADPINGQQLGDEQGPLRVVVPHDTRPVRSLRMLRSLELVRFRK